MISPFKIVNILVLLTSFIGVLPLYPHLEIFPKIILPVFAIFGVVAHIRNIKVSPKLLTIISIGLFLYYAPSFGHNNIVTPASNLLGSFMAIRLAGERNARTALQTSALSIICLAASTLFALGPTFLFSLLILSLLLISTLIILTFHQADKNLILSRFEIISLAKLIISTVGVTIPLMLLFFTILPRTQFPLWNAFVGKEATKGGISERVEPGKPQSIETDNSLAFRVETRQIDNKDLYWRSVVFNSYTAGAWIKTAVPSGETGVPAPGKRIQQTIYPEPGRFHYLPAMDPPLQITASRSSTTGDLVTTQPSDRTKYEAVSVQTDTIRTHKDIDRRFYLRLPTYMPPRLARIADEIGRTGKNNKEKLSLAKDFFTSSNLRYSTSNLPTGKDHLDRFLFDEKKGHCEFFASSLALVMRGAGVPARVIGGYYGGTYNRFGGYYSVSDDMAHAWTEVFLDDEGWKRIDPSTWSQGFAEISINRTKGIFKSIANVVDTFTYYWDVKVVTYDLETQIHLARNTGKLLRYEKLPELPGKIAIGGGAIVAIIFLIFRLKRFKTRSSDSALIMNFIRLSGYESKPKGKGILDIADEWGDAKASRFAEVYSNAIYNDRNLSKAEKYELKTLLRTLKRLRRSS